MRVVGDHLVYRPAHPNYRPETVNAASLCWTTSGPGAPHLLVSFRSASAKMAPDGRVLLCRSDDDGRAWAPVPSPLEPLRREEEPSLAGTQIGASSGGTTILTAARMWIVEPGSPDWDDDAAGLVHADAVTVRADASGEWEAPGTWDFRRHRDEWAIPCGPPLSIGGGEWVLPMERHARVYVPDWLRRYHAFVAFSHDDGRTWSEQLPTLNDPEERLAYYDQRMTLLGDGRLLTLAWVHDVVDDVTVPARAGYSSDGGRTWTEPFETGIQGGPLNPITLRDGRILTVYTRRTAPAGIRAVLSEDGGRTWALDREMLVWDDTVRRVTGEPARIRGREEADPSLWGTMWGWTFGTPVAAELPDSTVAVTFFAAGYDGVYEIRCARLEV